MRRSNCADERKRQSPPRDARKPEPPAAAALDFRFALRRGFRAQGQAAKPEHFSRSHSRLPRRCPQLPLEYSGKS